MNEKGGDITDADLDSIRNICRCGTYIRIREAITAGAARDVAGGFEGGGRWPDGRPSTTPTQAGAVLPEPM